MATINKNKVSAANSTNCLCHNKGMANKLLTLSKIQFSNLRLASSHIPAHAVDDTQASQIGTVESVKFFSSKYKTPHPTKIISKVIAQSCLLFIDILTG